MTSEYVEVELKTLLERTLCFFGIEGLVSSQVAEAPRGACSCPPRGRSSARQGAGPPGRGIRGGTPMKPKKRKEAMA